MVYRSCYCSCNVLIQQWIRQMTYGSSHHCCSHKISEKSIQQILCFTVGLIHSKSDKYSKAQKKSKRTKYLGQIIYFQCKTCHFYGTLELFYCHNLKYFFLLSIGCHCCETSHGLQNSWVSIQYRENTCREHGIYTALRRLWKVVSSSKYNWLRLTGGYFCVSKPTNKVESFYFHGNVFGLSMNERRRNPRMSESSREQYSKSSREAIINLRILFSFP